MEEKPEIIEAIGVPIAQSPNFRTFYSNSSRMGISPWDIRFTLGQVIEVPPGRQINLDEATFVMVPAHAKIFWENLGKTIEKFEQSFGQIVVPAAVRGQVKQTMPKEESATKPAKRKTKFRKTS